MKKTPNVPDLIRCVNCLGLGHTYSHCPKIKCSTCLKIGHIHTNCPLNKPKCFLCGKIGHKKEDCPNKSKNTNIIN